MAHPAYNLPNEDCPVCDAPSRTRLVGGRLVEEDRSAPNGIGWSEHTFECEHGHRWVVREVSARAR
jgi:hypothetical protein